MGCVYFSLKMEVICITKKKKHEFIAGMGVGLTWLEIHDVG